MPQTQHNSDLADLLFLKPKNTQSYTPKELEVQAQTDQLIHLLRDKKKGMTDAAKTLGICRKTAYNYFNNWKETTEAQQIDIEWWTLIQRLKEEYPEKALEALTRLKYRMTPDRVQADINIRSIQVVASWDNKFNQSQPTTTPPTLDKQNSTVIQLDSVSSPAGVDGAKTTAPSMKPSNTASQNEA